ncbi:hypothetical protein GCM10028814_21670 [Angustibacter aerolatus]
MSELLRTAAERGAVAHGLQLAGYGVALVRAVTALRLHGVEHGPLPSCVGPVPYLRNAGRMRVGERFAVRGVQTRASLVTAPGGELTIGDRVFVNQGATIHAEQSVTIGSHVHVGDGVALCDTDFHEVDPGEGVHVAPVVIGDGVWLARSVTVLPGAVVGEGTVVAAGSVVRGELPPWVVAAGAPARPVRDVRTRGRRR